MVANFFNRSAFVLPEVGRYGTAGRSVFSGPAVVSTDLAILKDIKILERQQLQFRAEFFNLFNQVNFNNPVANLSSTTYGQINGSASGRVIQFGLKYLW
jgi:hypothetical protein